LWLGEVQGLQPAGARRLRLTGGRGGAYLGGLCTCRRFGRQQAAVSWAGGCHPRELDGVRGQYWRAVRPLICSAQCRVIRVMSSVAVLRASSTSRAVCSQRSCQVTTWPASV